MARYIDLRVTTDSTTSIPTDTVVTLPPHQTDDLLVIFSSADRAGTFSCSGWTASNQSGTVSLGVLYLKATSGSTADPTVAFSTNSARTSHVAAVFRGQDTSTALDIAVTYSAVATDDDIAMPTGTPASANGLVVGCVVSRSPFEGWEHDVSVYSPLSLVNDASDNAPTISLGMYVEKDSSGTTTSWRARNVYGSRVCSACILSIKDAGNRDDGGMVSIESSPATLVHSVHYQNNDFRSGDLQNGSDQKFDPTAIVTSVPGHASSPTYGGTLAPDNLQVSNSNTSFTRLGISCASAGNRFVPLLVGTGLASAQDFSSSILSFTYKAFPQILESLNDGGAWLSVLGGTADTWARTWRFAAAGAAINPDASNLYQIQCSRSGSTNESEDISTVDLTTVERLVFGYSNALTSSSAKKSTFGPIYVLGTMEIVSGSSSFPASFKSAERHAQGAQLLQTVTAQAGRAAGQYFCAQSIQIGDGGTHTTYWNSTNQSVEYPAAFDIDGGAIHSNIAASVYTLTIYPGASDTLTLDKTTLNMGNLHNVTFNNGATGGTISTSGLVIIGGTVEWSDYGTHAFSGITFSACTEITNDGSAADFSGGNTFSGCVDAQQFTVTSEAEWDVLQNCTFADMSALSILITGNQSGTWSGTGITVSGGGGSYDIEYTGTTNFTIEFDTGSGFSQGRVNDGNESSGPEILTASTPTTDVTINVDIAANIKIFDGASTQTATKTETSATQLVYTYSGTKTWYYQVQLAGYIPQRGSITGTDEDLTVNVTLVEDPVYDSTHGLTYTTDYAYNITTRVLTIVAAQQGRDLYSSLIDEWIDNTALYNRPFPISAVGPDRFDFTSDGTTGATIDSGDVQYWLGAGMEWIHDTTGNATHRYCSIKGVGTNASGVKAFYQYAAGSGTTAMTALVSNNVDQVVQYYSDPNGDGSTADGYDRSTHLVVKLFNEGYYQARVDILTAFGISALEPFEYTVALSGEAFDFASGDQSITISTLTDDTGAPQDYGNSTAFSYELVDPGTNTAAQLAAQLNYDIFTDPTATLYTSYTAFNLPDIIIGSGGTYETEEGWVEDQDDTLGFYVSRSAADHPDFLRFEDDNGKYYTPTVTASFTVSGLQNSGSATRTRLHIFNTTASTSDTWAATTTYATGARVIRDVAGLGTEYTGGLFFVASTGGDSGGTEPTWDTTAGNTTADGTVVWTTYKALAYAVDPAGTSYADTYTDGEEFADGDSLRIRHAEVVDSTSFHSTSQTSDVTVDVASTGWTVTLAPAADSVYAANGVDGSAHTSTFALDVADSSTGLPEINLIADTDFTAEQAYAWFCYELTSDDGMHSFWGAVTAIDASNYRINTSIVDVLFDETVGAFIKQIASGAGIARIFRADGARPARDPTTGTYGVEINWQNPVYLAETGSVTAEGVAAEVVTQLNSTAQSEPTGAPAANASLGTKIGYLFAALRNKVTVTASTKTFYDDADASLYSKALSDDDTTYTEDEAA